MAIVISTEQVREEVFSGLKQNLGPFEARMVIFQGNLKEKRYRICIRKTCSSDLVKFLKAEYPGVYFIPNTIRDDTLGFIVYEITENADRVFRLNEDFFHECLYRSFILFRDSKEGEKK